MIPFINQAVMIGYTTKQILDYIGRKESKLRKGIDSARNNGYQDEDILRFLGGKIKPTNQKAANKQLSDYDKYLKSSGLKTPEERKEQTLKNIGTAVKVGGGLWAAYKAYNFGQTLPQNPTDLIEAEAEILGSRPVEEVKETLQLPGKEPKQIEMGKQPPIPPESSIIEGHYEKPTKLIDYILEGVDQENIPGWMREKLKFVQQAANKLQKEGKTPESPEAEKLKSKVQELLKQKPKTEEIERERFLKGHPEAEVTEEEAKQTLEQQPQELPTKEVLKSEIEPTKLEPETKISKGDDVVTPDGKLGKIKAHSGNNFLIEVDGKIKKVPMSELRGQPEAIKNAEIVFNPSNVPENLRSAALGMSVPLPDRSAIIQMFTSSGDVYMYKRKDGKPIDESIVRQIIDGTELPISTGETYMGAWDAETPDSRGAASYRELVKLSQKEDEENDPSKPYYVTKLEDNFIHGYLKEFMLLLKEATSEFKRKPPKPKKINEKKAKKQRS